MKCNWVLLVGALCVGAEAFGIFGFESLPSYPKGEEVGEIIFNRSDSHANDSEHVTMEREEFLRFFTEGTFQNKEPESIFGSEKYAKPLNDKGGWRYCRGAFATKTGAVFFFHRPRVGVLAIEDSQHRTGFLILN